MQGKKRPAAPLGASLVVVSSLVYASYGVWIKLLGNFLGDFTQGVVRSVLVILLLLPMAIWGKQLSRMHWRRDFWHLVGLLIAAFFISAPLFYAVKIIGVGLGIGVSYAGLVLGAFLFGWLIDHEQYTKDKLISTMLGLIGLWLIFTPSSKTFGLLALLAALVSGLASGLIMVVNKVIKYNATQTTLLVWSATAIINFPMIFLAKESFPKVQNDVHWLYLILFAIASLIASSLFIRGLKLIEAGAAGILGLLEIVFGVFLGIIFFNERLSWIVSAGLMCVLASAAIPYFQHYNSQKGTLS
jgi:drug/metabolite transporter (DMT)-like permease